MKRATSHVWGATLPAALLFGVITLTTGAKNGCIPVEPVDPTPECETPTDCEGLDHAMCAGAWSCETGACAWTCDTTPEGCTSDADCDAGFECNAADVCLPPPNCGPGLPCPFVCTGECVPKTEPGCLSDDDCGADQMCQPAPCPMYVAPCTPEFCPPCYGTCVDKPSGGDCSSDIDCGKGQYCEIMACTGCACPSGAPDCACPEPSCWGQCKDQAPVLACNSDSECPSGTSCQCGPDPSCPMCAVCLFQCLPDPGKQCTMDSGCGPNEACVLGPCPLAPCTPAGCPPCYGTCQTKPGGGECSLDSDCGLGQFCEIQGCAGCGCSDYGPCDCTSEPQCFGTCQDAPPPPPSCTNDADCPSGTICGCGYDPACPYCDMCMLQCIPDPSNKCETNDDCGQGEVCLHTPCPLMPCTPDYCPPCYGICGKQPPVSECVVSGCSGEVCSSQPMDSDCLWSPWYECLALTECGNYAPDGGCGWAKTPEFQDCIVKTGGPANP